MTLAYSGTAQAFWKDRSFTSYTGATNGKIVRDASGYYKPALQNLVPMSERIDSAYWTKNNNTTVLSGVAGPLAGFNATLWDDGVAVGVAHQIATPATVTAVNGMPFTVSVYLKSVSMPFVQILMGSTGYGTDSYANYDLSTGALGTVGSNSTATITDVGNGWYRITLTSIGTGNTSGSSIVFQVISSTTAVRGETLTGTNRQAYIWGVQYNVGMEALTYAATTAHNLCFQSQALGTSWTATDITVGTNDQTAPDGTATADSLTEGVAGTALLRSTAFTVPASAVVTASMYLKASTATWVRFTLADGSDTNGLRGWFNLATGAKGTLSAIGAGTATSHTITDVGNSWYRIDITGVCSTSTSLTISLSSADADASNTRVNSVVYIGWGAQAELATAAGKYTPTTTAAVYSQYYALPREWNAAGVCQGILVEEARTNLFLYSSDVGNGGGWAPSNVTVTRDVLGPAGVANSALSVLTTGSDVVRSGAITVVSATTYTMSVVVKAGTTSWLRLRVGDTTTPTNGWQAWFNISTGAVGQNSTIGTGWAFVSSSVTDFSNGWYRCNFTFTTSGTTLYGFVLTASGDGAGVIGSGNTYSIWQAQLETGTFPTSPIITGSASVTRARDKITNATTVLPFSTATGTWYAKGVYLGSSPVTYTPIVSVLAGDSINDRFPDMSLLTFAGGGAGWGRTDIRTGGVQTYDGGVSGTSAVNTSYKIATAFAANDAITAANGTLGTQDTSVTVGAVVDTVQIGGRANNGNLNGYVQQIMYLPVAKTDAELQTLTTP